MIAGTQEENVNCNGYFGFSIASLALISIEKSVLQSCQKIEFLGIIIDSQKMTLSLPQEEATAIIEQCQTFLSKDQVSLREISRPIGKLQSFQPHSTTFFSKATYCRVFNSPKLDSQSVSIFSSQDTIVLVEQQPKTGQWKVYSCFETSHDTIKYTSKKGWDSWPKLEAKDHLNVTRLPVTFGWNMLKRSD